MKFAGYVLALIGGIYASNLAALELRPCHLSVQQSPARVAAACGTFEVPENPEDPGGTTIVLAVAVLPATTRSQSADPLFFITGGPGQSALDSFVTARAAFGRINRNRDIVLVDQRGTGSSNKQSCPVSEGMDPLQFDPARHRELLAACFEEMTGDPRLYTTSVAIRDLDLVRAALGYERINVYGISYGSRVAQAYARRYPDRVRTVILDGIVPMQLALGPGISVDAQRALDLIFERCAADSECNGRFPSLADSFSRLQSQLRAAPVQLVLADPMTGELAEHSFTEDYFRSVVRMFSYAPETVALLPLLIEHAAHTGDFVPLAAQAVMVNKQLGEAIAIGMHNAVVCTEDVPYIADVDGLEATYLGASTLDALRVACEIWPEGMIEADFKTAWTGDIPTLLLSGEVDPVTPPENGDIVMRGLSDAVHVIGPGQGHGMYMRGCVPLLMEDFIRAGTTEGLDTECVGRLRPAPFFLRFTGPNP